MTLPTFQANLERIYPFAKRNGVKKGFIQNINFQYSVRGENRLQMMDEDFLTSRMFDGAKSGFKHQIPLSTSFKVAKHFNFQLVEITKIHGYLKPFRKMITIRHLKPLLNKIQFGVLIGSVNTITVRV